jgi:hypothetical protein
VALDANSLSALENVTVTVGAGITGTVTVSNSVTISSLPAISGTVTIGSALPTGTNRIGVVTIGGGTVTIGAGTAQIGSVTASGTVTAVLAGWELLGQRDFYADGSNWSFSSSIIGSYSSIAIAFGDGGAGSLRAYYNPPEGQDNQVYWTFQDGGRTRDIDSGTGFLMATALPANLVVYVHSTPLATMTASLYGKKDSTLALTNTQLRASAVTVSGNVTIGTALPAGTNQIGSVTASINGTVPISISSVTVGNSVTIGSLPAISGTVTANTFALQGTAVTTSNFTSTTASTVLASFNATREVLTIFNEGAGNLHICAGATCTTIAYQVRLSAGDYYEVPNHQTSLTHSAVFATAGTARVCQVS